MATLINASTSGAGGLITTADASGQLELQTAGTTAVTVNGSQVASFTNNFGTVAGYPSYQCRAWVNFNGTGTVAIRASGNVSSITDNSAGDYTINFTTAMPDANYVAIGNLSMGGAGVFCGIDSSSASADATLKTTTQVRVQNYSGAGTAIDVAENNWAVFR